MKRLLLFLLLLAVPTASADLTVEIHNSRRPTTPPPTGTASEGQFGSAAFTSGGLDGKAAQGLATVVEVPKAGTGRLQQVVMGSSFAGGVPDYAFGDVIRPPSPVEDWRAQPVQPGETFTATSSVVGFPIAANTVQDFYYSIHSRQVYASRPGPVTVFWRKLLPNANGHFEVVRRDHLVSNAAGPETPTRRLFWNTGALGGPAVLMPSAVQKLHIDYRTQFPEFPQGGTTNAQRSVYLDEQPGSKTLSAQLIEGRVFIEFLGSLIVPSSGRRLPLGTTVVDIASEPVPGQTDFDVTTFLGEQLIPSDGDLALTPDVRSGVTSSPAFIANRPLNGKPAFFAEVETTTPSDVRIFWRETDPIGILWPRFRNNYSLVWPDQGTPGAFAINTLPDAGDTTATSVDLFNENTPELKFQDNASGEATIQSGRLSVNPGADGSNRSLLLLQSGSRFWYVRVFSGTQTVIASLPAELQTTYQSGAAVGDRLVPPSDRGPGLSRAGHIHATGGTAWHPGAYLDPMTAGFPAAELRSEIIPVNKTTANETLTVWWYRKMEAPAAGFQPLYWPAVVGTYSLSWPGDTVASQSSTFTPAEQYSADKALDGDPATFSHTAASRANPWWKIDYAQSSYFTSVTLLNRTGCCMARLRDITVEVLDGAGTVVWQSPLLNPGNAAYTFPAGPAMLVIEGINTAGRSIRIRRTSSPSTIGSGDDRHVLALAEVDIASRSDPREIVMASNDGTGALTAAESAGSIYYQNDPTLPGYNPNEEHALMLGGQGYALRDDLNVADVSSRPFVLVDYVHPVDQRRALSVFKVLRENLQHTFDYPADAGTVLQAPMPLPLLPVPMVLNPENVLVSKNEEVLNAALDDPDSATATPAHYDKFTFNDRKGTTWIYRGPHGNNAAARVLMKYHYNLQPGFAFPNPTTGVDERSTAEAIQPYLRTRSGQTWTSTPETITFIPQWPAQVPTLQFGETLTNPKAGLPAVRGQTSTQVFYDQSSATDTAGLRTAVALFDGTRAKTYQLGTGSPLLDAIPGDIATDSRNGKTYFQKLPPHLKERFYFNPLVGTKGALVLEGKFVDDVVGEDYLLLNVLSNQDLLTIQNLSTEAAWDTAAQNLTTSVETFVESTQTAGTWVPASNPASYTSTGLPLITSPDQAVDSYALSTRGTGSGYVTLVFGNGKAFTPESEPVSVSVIRVGPDLYTGQAKVLASANPLDEKVTLRHSADFAARPQDFEFEWRYAPPADGVVPSHTDTADTPGPAWIDAGTGLGNTHIVGGSGILALSDNYWTLRYKPTAAGHPKRNVWSPWTQPALVEGWIKRALAGINPFNQRVTDFFNNGVNTDVSILTQAGRRWEGNIALNLANINEFGLIEIYETILQRGAGLSINGTPAINYGPANDALLLAGGYLADLYTILGDEAAADAANPTIAFDAAAIGSVAQSSVAVDFASVFSQTATARFAFQGQVGNLLEEELALLRGRDDVNSPGVELSPSYNRMFWNYTRGITAGEVIYALNYNIRERQADAADGKIDATDASRMFPQAHGDAYGHYLTATKNYYRLLTDPDFTWAPRVEAVNILGVPVQVDYLDERKFATAAARTAKSARQIAGLVHRQAYSADAAGGWQHFREGINAEVNYREGKATSSKRTRHWGLDEWHARGAQGSYFHWIIANAILPATSTATGIQKIDRTTVPELDELAQLAADMQQTADSANGRLSPLGLAAGSTLFDISPTELAAGKSHFEQVQERATRALGNAFDTFDQATASTRLLRSLENQGDDLSAAVFDQERAFNLELIELYGTPYAGDIGPGKTYVQGYTGPDLLRYFYINKVTEFSDPFDITGATDIAGGTGGDGSVTFVLKTASYSATQYADAYSSGSLYNAFSPPPYTAPITYVIRPDAPVQYATAAMGQRQSPGQIQLALQDLNAKREAMVSVLDTYSSNETVFVTELEIFREAILAYEAKQDISAKTRDSIMGLQTIIASLGHVSRLAAALQEDQENIADTLKEALPLSVGVSSDATSVARAAFKAAADVAGVVLRYASVNAESAAEFTGNGVSFLENDLDRKLEEAGFPAEFHRMGADLQTAFSDWIGAGPSVDQAALALEQSRLQLAALVAKGQSVQSARETFRKRAAAITQGYRTRDVAFRAFRTESLEQYQTLLDWAARYAFLAAKAYDYETGLLGTPQGQAFLNDIVSSRALGLRNAAGQPIFGASSTGDPGISGLLAKLNSDWSSVRTRLGFNNPDTHGTVFSFRQENYRIPGDSTATDGDNDFNNDSQDDRTWKEQMQSLIVSDIRTDSDVATHCLQLSNATAPVPGLIIPFSTSIQDGYNFFGLPLAAGDSAFSSTSFATKIHSIGISLDGYVGMNNFATGSPTATGPASNAPNALSATPYVFLIPTGRDVMRTPPLGDTSITREFAVQDYALPLPFNIGDSQFSNVSFWTGNDSLTEDFLTPRKHQAFRAVDHPFYFYVPLTADFTSRRLVGRSVWNTGWKLVIPANTLLNNSSEGMSRFLKTVHDIKLYVRSYSYSGN